MWADLRSPVTIAHRGDCAHAPENTLAAFQSAVAKGAEAIEFDVKLTADQQVVVIHDQKVERTTNGRGDVRHFTLKDLQALDGGAWFDEKYRGEKIPRLEEVFEAVGARIHMNVELTNYATPQDDLVAKVVAVIRKHGMEEQVLFSSFFPRNLRKASVLLPEVPCGLLVWKGWAGYPARSWGWRKGYQAVHPHVSDVNVGFIARVHAAGKRVNVWTVNDREEMQRLIGLGVDGIFTDDPALLGKCLGRET